MLSKILNLLNLKNIKTQDANMQERCLLKVVAAKRDTEMYPENIGLLMKMHPYLPGRLRG